MSSATPTRYCTDADLSAPGVDYNNLPCLINPYRYLPSLPMGISFAIIFAASSALFVWQIYGRAPRRYKWMVVFPICGFWEMVGWAGRVWSYYDIEGSGYLVQIVCLVISPTLISAGLYLLLGVLIQRLAPKHSPLSGKRFKIIFICADVASLGVQAAGGGIAATADTDGDAQMGSRIMLAGIIVQLVIMVVYSAYGLVWYNRSKSTVNQLATTLPGGRGIKIVLVGMTISSAMIIIRGIFRSVELSEGFQGPIATNQFLFLLDAIPVVIAMLALNVCSPNKYLACLDNHNGRAGDTEMEARSGTNSRESFTEK